MEVLDKGVDELFMKFLAQHFKGENELLFAGPDNGAHNPIYFYTVQDLPKRYPGLKKILEIVRSTAGMYSHPDRSLTGINKAWCLATDFDYDRGEWAGIKKKVQDTTLYEFCQIMPPTATVRTGHGWHLYWVLDKPMSSFDYAYPASLIKASIKADPRSILPVQCLNFHSKNPKKPAVMVDGLTLESIGKHIPTFPEDTNYYNLQDILKALGKRESKALQKLRKAVYAKYTPYDEDVVVRRKAWRNDAMDIMEHIDIVGALNSAGYMAYNRGGKVICCCPFHDDRHPSAYIDIEPESDYFGWFFCTSTSCHKHAPLRKVLREIGVEI